MDFKTKVGELMSQGYKRASARAKIAHDVVLAAIVARLSEVFQDAIFKRQLRNKKFAWLNVAPEIATKAILDYVLTIR